ncbi:MAG: flagellar motor switch protein FliN [Deltaproteobacteria bacterium]|nr:flagellar motor switch protein FliN [Deltaproteobacteria bacterium]
MNDSRNSKADTLTGPQAGNNAEAQEGYDFDFILDIPLDVSVELGKVKMLVNDLLQLGQGSIIELEKSTAEPLEIYVNNKLIARGEVVVVDDRFGIRVTNIISPLERVKTLG